MKEVCSLYNSPVGLITISNDGYYTTHVIFGNHTNKFSFEPNNSVNAKVMEELDEYFQGNRQTFDIPIKPEGTPFQKKVWNALLKIPYGETRSYSEIADDINRPSSIRAIGSANANNPIVILIPCHRVINANGSLPKYSGGIFLKKKLLELEKNTLNKQNQEFAIEDNLSDSLLKISLYNINIYDFYYYIKTDVCINPERTCKQFNIKSKYENFIQTFSQECVYIQDRYIFKEAFQKINDIKKYIQFEIRNITGDIWYKTTISVAQYDSQNNPLIIIGLVEDITELKNIEYEKQRLSTLNQEITVSLNQIFLETLKLDLNTQKIYKLDFSSSLQETLLNPNQNFNDWLLDKIEKYYHPSDRCRLYSKFNIENLLKLRDNGSSQIEERFRVLINDSYNWICTNIILNNEPNTKNTVIIFKKNINQIYQQNDIMYALGNEYYALYYVDIENNLYQMIRSDVIVRKTINVQSVGIYKNIVTDYIKNFVHEDEQQAMLEFTSIENLEKSLNHNNSKISKIFRKKIGSHFEYVEMNFILSYRSIDISNMIILALKNVDETTRTELENKELLEIALSHSKAIDTSKNEVLEKISNDIRTPLSTIIGYTTLAKNSINNPEKLSKYLDIIFNHGNKILSMIDNIYNFKEIETQSLDTNLEEIDLLEFIKSIIEIITPHITKKNITFNYHVNDIKHEKIISVAQKIKPLFINTLTNAINYSYISGAIDFTMEELPSMQKDYIPYRFTIKDTGIGIKEDELPNVFTTFYRGSNVGSVKGAGIGLSICANIVKLLNGEINIYSKLGNGTTITFTVMFKVIDTPPIKLNTFPNFKVLVVNNNPLELEYICNTLDSLNIQNTSIYMGRNIVPEILLSHIKQQDYSIIMLDDKVSNAKYIDLIKSIHENIGNRNIKIVITTFEYELITINTKNLNIDYVLSKPLFKSHLIKMFNTLTPLLLECYNNNPFESKPLKDTHCLLVENNPVNRLLSKELISLTGATVTDTDTQEQTLEIFKENPKRYNFIVIDTSIPNIDYSKILLKIKIINENIPIIAMSSNHIPEDISKMIKMGFTAHIVKPLDNNINTFVYTVLNNLK